MDKKLHTGAWLISAPLRCGKSTFVKQVLENRANLFHEKPVKILYAFSTWTEGYEDLAKDPEISMVQGLPDQD